MRDNVRIAARTTVRAHRINEMLDMFVTFQFVEILFDPSIRDGLRRCTARLRLRTREDGKSNGWEEKGWIDVRAEGDVVPMGNIAQERVDYSRHIEYPPAPERFPEFLKNPFVPHYSIVFEDDNSPYSNYWEHFFVRTN